MRHYESSEFSFVFELPVPLGFLPGRGGPEQRHWLHGAAGLGLSGAKRKSKTDRILPFPSCGKLTPSKVFPPPLEGSAHIMRPHILTAAAADMGRRGPTESGGESLRGAKFCPLLSLLSALEKGVPPSGEGKSQRLLSMRM